MVAGVLTLGIGIAVLYLGILGILQRTAIGLRFYYFEFDISPYYPS